MVRAAGMVSGHGYGRGNQDLNQNQDQTRCPDQDQNNSSKNVNMLSTFPPWTPIFSLLREKTFGRNKKRPQIFATKAQRASLCCDIDNSLAKYSIYCRLLIGSHWLVSENTQQGRWEYLGEVKEL
jgi:hypothetical protein